MEFRNEYEEKIAGLKRELSIQIGIHQENESKRREQAEDIRKAFMRGLSSLNIETLNLLQHNAASEYVPILAVSIFSLKKPKLCVH
jgi:hypothetical protein